jgi:membrane protein
MQPKRRILRYTGRMSVEMSSPRRGRLFQRFGARLRLAASFVRVRRFVAFVYARFMDDQGMQLSAGLSYVSLLALVPMIAIALAILAAFPAFDAAREQIRDLVQAVFPPGSPVEVATYYDEFLANASNLTAPGVIGLAVTAVLLLSTIDDVLSRIFRESASRPFALRFLIYWAVLTVGPLLFGASISISSYLFAIADVGPLVEEEGPAEGLLVLSRLIAVGLSTIGFALIFMVVPHRPVRAVHALAGGLAAAILLEILKYGFGMYIANVRGYEVLYGALAAIPLFLLWLYLAWIVVLIGAEVAASIPEWRYASARGAPLRQPGDKLSLALTLLERLQRGAESGRKVTQTGLHRGIPATPTEVDVMIGSLKAHGLIDRGSRGRLLLARDLRTVPLSELLKALSLDPHPTRNWPGETDPIGRRWAEQGEAYAQTPLADLLNPTPEREAGTVQPEAIPGPRVVHSRDGSPPV